KGTWKRKDSIFTASFDREKLFYKIKNGSTILRVGSDLKEITGEMAAGYTFKRTEDFDDDNILGKYITGDTLGAYREIKIFRSKKVLGNAKTRFLQRRLIEKNYFIKLKMALQY